MRKKVKRKKKHHLNRLKTRKAGSSWFKLVYFDIFLLIYFRFSTIIITFATKYQFKHTSNNLKRYINEPTLKSKACLKCLYFTKIISDLCRNLEYFSYLYTIN
jgi:hypothetical protein